jgi:hypothetical protein
MTAKDKAFELYKMYNNLIVEQVIEMKPTYLLMTHEMAKKSALIAVNEILKEKNGCSKYECYGQDINWNKVKQEIQNL